MRKEDAKNNIESLPNEPAFTYRLIEAIGSMGSRCRVRFGYNGENYIATLTPKVEEISKGLIRLIQSNTERSFEEGKASFEISGTTYTLSVRKTNPDINS